MENICRVVRCCTQETRDDKLKKWIRILKFISRTLGVLLSLATVVPLALITQKYLSTRNAYFNVNGTSRTAWPTDTKTVYNYVYLTLSVISLLLNITILLAYFRGIQHASFVARINAIWTGIILAAHIIAMIAGVAVYKAGSSQNSPNGSIGTSGAGRVVRVPKRFSLGSRI
jgi:hypothetical protein